MGAAKVIDGRDKSKRTAAGDDGKMEWQPATKVSTVA